MISEAAGVEMQHYIYLVVPSSMYHAYDASSV